MTEVVSGARAFERFHRVSEENERIGELEEQLLDSPRKRPAPDRDKLISLPAAKRARVSHSPGCSCTDCTGTVSDAPARKSSTVHKPKSTSLNEGAVSSAATAAEAASSPAPLPVDSKGTPSSTRWLSAGAVAVTFTGFKESTPGFNAAAKERLAKIVTDLGGRVVTSSEDVGPTITHCVVPPYCRTAKSLQASLLGKWIVMPSWLETSAETKAFVDESAHGCRAIFNEFIGAKFFLTPAFQKECVDQKKCGRFALCELLLGKAARGLLLDDPEGANFVVDAQNSKPFYDGSDKVVLNWNQLLQRIRLPDPARRSSWAQRSTESDSGSERKPADCGNKMAPATGFGKKHGTPPTKDRQSLRPSAAAEARPAVAEKRDVVMKPATASPASSGASAGEPKRRVSFKASSGSGSGSERKRRISALSASSKQDVSADEDSDGGTSAALRAASKLTPLPARGKYKLRDEDSHEAPLGSSLPSSWSRAPNLGAAACLGVSPASAAAASERVQKRLGHQEVHCETCGYPYSTLEIASHQSACTQRMTMFSQDEKLAIELGRSELSLTSAQMAALKWIETVSKLKSSYAKPKLIARFVRLGFTEKQLSTTLRYIRNDVPLIIHVNLDRVLDGFLKDTHYRNQFETGTSGGALSFHARRTWEDRIFNNMYHDSKPFDRVKYGVLNIVKDPNGVLSCSAYGDSYLLLKSERVRLRATFASQDTSSSSVVLSSCEHYCHVLSEYTDQEIKDIVAVATGAIRCIDSRNVVHYKEMQIHGPLEFAMDLEAVVANKRHKSSKSVVQMLELFCRKNALQLKWTE